MSNLFQNNYYAACGKGDGDDKNQLDILRLLLDIKVTKYID